MLSRRSFLQLASGLLVAAHEPVRAYSFLNPAWMPPLAMTLDRDGIEGQLCAVQSSDRALSIAAPGGQMLFTMPAGKQNAAEFVYHGGVWHLVAYGPQWLPRSAHADYWSAKARYEVLL
jgi:hypothetical protein